ncbi:MAG: type II secretion system protein GspL [Magnetococcus sp. DMHC-6]
MSGPIFLFFSELVQGVDPGVIWVDSDHFNANPAEKKNVQPEPLAGLGGRLSGRRVVAVVPGTEVLLTRVRLPKTSRANIEKAVPFQLEEQIIGGVESVYFALGQRSLEDGWPVAVVSKQRMNRWLEDLSALGIRPEAMVSEVDLLPLEIGVWTLLEFFERFLVRTAVHAGFAVDAGNLELALESAARGGEHPTRSALRVVNGLTEPLRAMDGVEKLGLTVTIEGEHEDPYVFLARHYVASEAINLLQGRLSQRHHWLGVLRPFWSTVALLAVYLGWIVAQRVVEDQQLGRQIESMDQQIEAVYRQAFPDVRKVVDPKAQMKLFLNDKNNLNLKPSSVKSGFLDLYGLVGPEIQKATGVITERLRYQEGKLEIHVRCVDLQQLDQLKERLGNLAGLSVELLSAAQDDQGVVGHVRIGVGGK